MELQSLTRQIREAPPTPGVYTWRNARRVPLYIGKATNLKSRLSHYAKTSDTRITAMIADAASVSWQETATDIEALILESQLIKRWHPKFNIVMRDDKQYFYVAITHEDFPHISLTHQPLRIASSKSQPDFIGPFTEGAPLKTTLHILRTLFPYCTCKQKHHVRCLNAHIGKCPGYCCLRTSATREEHAEYRRNIRAIRNILTGKRNVLIKNLEREMVAAGKEHNLERAIDLQKKLERVRRVFENALINASRERAAAQHFGALELMQKEFNLPESPVRIEGYDIANIQGEHASGSMVVFTHGHADNQEYRLFNIKTVSGSNDVAMLTEVLTRRFAHREWIFPDLIVIDGGRAQLNAAIRVVDACGLDIPIISLTKNDRHRGDHVLFSRDARVRALRDLSPAIDHLIVHVDAEAHRFAISQYRRRHRKVMR